jgi:hypothetical protein
MATRSAISTIKGFAAQGAVVFSEHALVESMGDDDVFPDDVLHVLVHANECLAQDDNGVKFKVYGPISNGDDYAVVVNVNDDHLFVITCHLPP